MKISIKKSKKPAGFSFIELTISIAIFAQIMIMVSGAIIAALQLNQFNKAIKNVNIEIYSIVTNGIGAYIRKATGIMYEGHLLATSKVGTKINSIHGGSDFERECSEDEKLNKFDQLTLFQDKEKKHYISFAVEKDESENISRIVWRKDDGPGYYLNSEDTYITCFLVSVSPNPYGSDNKKLKDIQPYVQLYIAGKYRYTNDTSGEEKSFFQHSTQIAYKTTFTLRNYYY